jgi:hypothetical protein
LTDVAIEDRGHSMFCMDDVTRVSYMPFLAGKAEALRLVKASSANLKNTSKASRIIIGSKNKIHLISSMANFILAHPSEKLKVI